MEFVDTKFSEKNTIRHHIGTKNFKIKEIQMIIEHILKSDKYSEVQRRVTTGEMKCRLWEINGNWIKKM